MWGGVNLGCLRSFITLLQYAVEDGAQIFAFADQDDVWLSDKLSRGIECILDSVNPRGALYYSNKTFVDAQLNFIRNESITFYNDYAELLWRSQASGCTMVFNRTLAEYAVRRIPSVRNCLHDAWVYRMAKVIGSDIRFDSNPHIWYRLHSENTCGLDGLRYYGNLHYLIKNFIGKLLHSREHFLQNTVKDIVETTQDNGEWENKIYTEAVLKYNTSWHDKCVLLRMKEMKKRPLTMRIIWCYRVLFNMI